LLPSFHNIILGILSFFLPIHSVIISFPIFSQCSFLPPFLPHSLNSIFYLFLPSYHSIHFHFFHYSSLHAILCHTSFHTFPNCSKFHFTHFHYS
jgi:hypothetical protein